MAEGITREQIVTAALEPLDDQGTDALVVRALASRLDVRASALYSIDQRDAWLGEGAALAKEAGRTLPGGDRRFNRLRANVSRPGSPSPRPGPC